MCVGTGTMAARIHFLAMLLSLLALFTAIDAACTSPPLGNPYPDEDVVTVKYASFVTQITLKEGYPDATQQNIRIAVFNCDESDEPTIETFTTGSQTSLGLDKEHSGNKWYLVVNKTQDYENPNQRYYRFNVAAGTQKHDVALSIINVDDESPYFNLPDSASCQIKETLTGNSSCHLLVYDPDAIMDNMTYTVLEAGKESENISLADVDAELCTAADAESCITVALNIIREIEFIDQPVHSLLLTVQDNANHTGNISYIVQVIAENKETPHITPQHLTIEIDEETPGIIDINTNITVSDRDALDYGQFNIAVEGKELDTCSKAFDVIPKSGYRNTDVRLSVIEPELLDYENGTCNDIILKIKATETFNESRAGEAEVTVKLRDLNDESPVFEQEEFVFNAAEHEVKGTHLGYVKAIDRDAFDKITYSLASDAYLTIDPETGSVKVEADFNYERQPQVFATVKAEDTNARPHFAYAQIVVNVTDINDEKPLLYVPSSPATINESTAIGTELGVTITATDEDTMPDLSFSIDWNNSRAAKQGIPQKQELFNGCLKIETVKDPEHSKDVSAVLEVDMDIHWEDFDTLYVNISVEDRNTQQDYAQNRFSNAILTVMINDINNNAPEFSDPGLLTFKENTQEGTLFGIIKATDKDGPGNNDVKYSLVNHHYKQEYVTISETNGELRTGKDPIDFEAIEEIEYTIVASDGVHDTPLNITIQIEDVNDETPYFIGDYSSTIPLAENTNERTDLLQIRARDNDSSAQFNTLTYFVEGDHRGLFEIDSESGLFYLPDGQGNKLDYEGLINTYVIDITVRDRCEKDGYCYGDSRSNTTRITVQLTDVNDNAPVIDNKGSVLRTISEDEGKRDLRLGFVTATDADSGENADLKFSFIDVKPAVAWDLFDIGPMDPIRAEVIVKKDLLDYWGQYTVTVMAADIGNLNDTADFTIIVTDINNNKPEFVYPTGTTVIRLNIFNNSPGKVLTDMNGKNVVFSAIDGKDNGLNGTAGMSYTITGDDVALQYLEVSRDELWLKEDFDQNMDKSFPLKLEACDGEFETNKQCTSVETKVTLTVNAQFEPTFDKPEWTTNFTENSTGLAETRKIDVSVTDVNNADGCEESDDCAADPIYYFIFDGNTDIFNLEAESGILSLKQELDREEQSVYTLTVVVTNFDDGPHAKPGNRSMLEVTINVIDLIDTAPVFAKKLFAAGINIGDKVNDVVTTFNATDEDLDDQLTYHIVAESMDVTDSTLDYLIGRDPFKINGDKLQLGFEVQDTSLRGMFTFDVQVSDKGGFTDDAACQIYIISEANLVSMRFQNNESFVESKKAEIAKIYTEVLKYQSNVKKVARALNSQGAPMDNATDVTSYFVDENKQQPVNKEEITKAINNKDTYNQLRYELYGQQQLVLDSVDDTQSETEANVEGLLQTVLIVVSVVLGTLVVVLFAAFFIRTRSLNRRLEALSTTKFGSQDSGLNRIGLAVPNTNQHAVEGSNPVWGNEELVDRNFDNVSQSSGDSDLIGVEENPEFNPYGKSGLSNDGFTPDFETGRRVSINPMLASGLNPLSAASLQDAMAEKTTVNKSVNPMAGMFNSDGYDSDKDSIRSSENVMGQKSNFTFFGRMDSIPITEL